MSPVITMSLGLEIGTWTKKQTDETDNDRMSHSSTSVQRVRFGVNRGIRIH
jgi:hypothetical protein